MALCTTTFGSLPHVAEEIQNRTDADDVSPSAHAAMFGQISALHAIETFTSPGNPKSIIAPASVISWNIERGYQVNDIADHIANIDADVVLLTEVDYGMARTGQLNIARELSSRLGMNFTFAVEYLELGLGSERERGIFRGQTNSVGFHGAAILSKAQLIRPALVRLESSGNWYTHEYDERRIGGRMALIATILLDDQPTTFCTTHFENRSTPQIRAEQMGVLLTAIQLYSQESPVIIGGDFNTNTAERNRDDWEAYQVEKESVNPGYFANPIAHEPMFEVAAQWGYEWRNCNIDGPTTRLHTWQPANKPRSKLDWFFTKGLKSQGPAIISSKYDKTGAILSDHDMLRVSIRHLDTQFGM